MNKFKIGDRVIHKRMDIIGTIRVIDDTSLPYGVEFDDKISGLNNLQGLCEIGHGLWVSEEDIELEKEVNSLDKEKRIKMSEFKVGDRVKYIGADSNYKGKVGTIVTIDDDSIPYGIEFDEKVYGGHTLDGECEYGYGKWFQLEEIELLINSTLEDYTTEELERELKKRKENKINEILEILNNNIKELRELGYTIPYKDNTTIDSLELNKALDSIGVFYE